MARHVAVSSSLEEQALSNEKPAGHKQPVLRQVFLRGNCKTTGSYNGLEGYYQTKRGALSYLAQARAGGLPQLSMMVTLHPAPNKFSTT